VEAAKYAMPVMEAARHVRAASHVNHVILHAIHAMDVKFVFHAMEAARRVNHAFPVKDAMPHVIHVTPVKPV